MNLQIYALLMTAALALPKGAHAADAQLVDGFINAPVSEVWRIFTTALTRHPGLLPVVVKYFV